MWSLGQAVKTPPSHGGIRGSIPLGTTKLNSLSGVFLLLSWGIEPEGSTPVGARPKILTHYVRRYFLPLCAKNSTPLSFLNAVAPRDYQVKEEKTHTGFFSFTMKLNLAVQ